MTFFMEEKEIIFKGKSYVLSVRDIFYCKKLWERMKHSSSFSVDDIFGDNFDDYSFLCGLSYLKDRNIETVRDRINDIISFLVLLECDECLINDLYIKNHQIQKDFLIVRNGESIFVNYGIMQLHSHHFQRYCLVNGDSVLSFDDEFSDEGFGFFIDLIHDKSCRISENYCWEVFVIAQVWECPSIIPFIPVCFFSDVSFFHEETVSYLLEFLDNDDSFLEQNIDQFVKSNDFCRLPLSFLHQVFERACFDIAEGQVRTLFRNVYKSHGISSLALFDIVKTKEPVFFSLHYGETPNPQEIISIDQQISCNISTHRETNQQPLSSHLNNRVMGAIHAAKVDSVDLFQKYVPRKLNPNSKLSNLLVFILMKHYYILLHQIIA